MARQKQKMLKRLTDSEFENFFRKVDAQLVFYPWEYPGEGFIVNEEQKNRIGLFLLIFMLTGILALFLIIILIQTGHVSDTLRDHLFLIMLLAAMPVYVFSIKVLKKGAKPLIIEQSNRPKKRHLFKALVLFNSVLGFGAIFLENIVAPTSPSILFVIYGVGILYSFYVAGKVIVTRGYFFTHGQPPSPLPEGGDQGEGLGT